MNLSQSDFQSMQSWMYRNARPLDLARWQFHFENGSKEAVLAALSAYQNEDGGFGHALEPDLWNPNTTPYATHVAVGILEEIQFRDRNHNMLQKILAYLDSTPHFDGERWETILPTNNDHPHAPWWVDTAYDWGYTPTALFAGFIIYYAPPQHSIYQKAEKIAEAAIQKYRYGTMPNGEAYHAVKREGEIQCLTKMIAFLEDAAGGHRYPLGELKKVLNQQAQGFIEKDDTKWTQYCWRPSVFVKSPGSIFYPGNEKAIQTELDYILGKRNLQGIWDITWTWGAYEKEFALSENWWKASLIIEHLLLLKSFGRF